MGLPKFNQQFSTLSDPVELPSATAKLPVRLIGPLLALLEFSSILIIALGTSLFYEFGAYGRASNVDLYLGIGGITSAFFVFWSCASGHYNYAFLVVGRQKIARITTDWVASVLATTFVLFVLKIGELPSRGALLIFFCVGIVWIVSVRRLAALLASKAWSSGLLKGKPGILIGTRDQLLGPNKSLIFRNYGTEIRAQYQLQNPSDQLALSKTNVAILNDAVSVAQRDGIEEIVLAVSWNNVRLLQLLREELRILPIAVRLLPDAAVSNVIALSQQKQRITNSVIIQREALSDFELWQKRVFDIVFSVIALILLSPLLLLICVAQLIDNSGPVFFKQRRKGFNGRAFDILKFRTMRVLENGTAIRQAQKDDDRITWLGRILRRSSVDELPQLFNVLKGDMSLIGPRPHAIAHDDYYKTEIADYAFRLHVKPGITGWAQINRSRGETPDVSHMKRRVDLDLWYIANWSLFLDFRIAFLTAFAVLREDGAY